jgi:hypothetical protein
MFVFWIGGRETGEEGEESGRGGVVEGAGAEGKRHAMSVPL